MCVSATSGRSGEVLIVWVVGIALEDRIRISITARRVIQDMSQRACARSVQDTIHMSKLEDESNS